ncbi:hypothetical protein D9M72_539640 [compost metagenome]
MIENDQKQVESSKDIYHNVGRFVIEFEQLLMSVRLCIFSIFKLKGLTEFDYLRVLLSDFTGAPLVGKLQTLFAMHCKDNPSRVKLLDKFFANTISIVEKRNEIIHGSFFVQSDYNANLFKDKANKSGLNPINEEVDSEMLLGYTNKIIKASEMYTILNSYLHEEDSVFDHFFNKETIEALSIKKK